MASRFERRFYPATGRFLNLGCGRDVRPDPWINMDGYHRARGILHHDLIDTPWPFEDGALDVVYASHVLEHIPPLFRPRDGVQRDVFFDVMEEIHRVLKPAGILHMKVPYGADADVALGNPQHYRQWMPGWFSFFDERSNESFYTGARFHLERLRLRRAAVRWPDRMRIRGYGLTVHLSVRLPFLRPLLLKAREMEAVLRKVPAGHAERPIHGPGAGSGAAHT